MKSIQVPRPDFLPGDYVNHKFSGSQVFVVVGVRYNLSSLSFVFDLSTLDGSLVPDVRGSNLIRLSTIVSSDCHLIQKGDILHCSYFPGKRFLVKRIDNSSKRVFLVPADVAGTRVGFWCGLSELVFPSNSHLCSA